MAFRLVPHFMCKSVADNPDAGKRPCENEQRSAATPCRAESAGRQRVASLRESGCHAPSLIPSMPLLRQRVHRRLTIHRKTIFTAEFRSARFPSRWTSPAEIDDARAAAKSAKEMVPRARFKEIQRSRFPRTHHTENGQGHTATKHTPSPSRTRTTSGTIPP